PASGSSRERFADDVMDDHIGRSAHLHSLLGQTFSSPISSAIHAVSWTQVKGPESPQCFSTWFSPRGASLATHAQAWPPAGWLYYTGRVSNPLDHCERFQIT